MAQRSTLARIGRTGTKVSAQRQLHIYIEGKLKTRHYEDKDGAKRYVTEVIGEQLIMLDKAIENG